MAAAYQTGTATSPTNLLQTLVTWLVAQGWTSNMSQADGTGWRAHLSKGSVYVNLRATPGSETVWAGGASSTANQIGIGLYTGTGYSGASAWNAQAGGPIGSAVAYTVGAFMNLPVGSIVAYHFFDDGADNIVVVAERTSSNFTHLGWGTSLTKAGAWTGGGYFFASTSGFYASYTSVAYPGTPNGPSAHPPFSYGDSVSGCCAFVRADVDTFTGKWLGCGSVASAQQGYTGKRVASGYYNRSGVVTMPSEIPQYGASFQARITSAMNSQANLIPIRLFAQRDTAGYSLIGDVPNLVLTNATDNGYAAGTVYPLGADNWMIFPNFAVLKKA